MPKVGSNQTCLAVMLTDLFLWKMRAIFCKCFSKNVNTSKKKKKWWDILLIT